MQVHIYKQIADRKKFVSFRNERTTLVFDAKKLTKRTDKEIEGYNTRGEFMTLVKQGDDWYATS